MTWALKQEYRERGGASSAYPKVKGGISLLHDSDRLEDITPLGGIFFSFR